MEVFDPTTNEVFYVVSAEQFQKLTSNSAVEHDPRDAYPLVDLVMAEDDAHDPLLETYQ